MKRSIAVGLILALLFSLGACGTGGSSGAAASVTAAAAEIAVQAPSEGQSAAQAPGEDHSAASENPAVGSADPGNSGAGSAVSGNPAVGSAEPGNPGEGSAVSENPAGSSAVSGNPASGSDSGNPAAEAPGAEDAGPEKEIASALRDRAPVAGTEIPITEIEPLLIGQTENRDAGTGCTVLICKDGMRAGLDVRGGGPASRESQLLNPLTAAQSIHAIVLSGGSAYGLGTANGVMTYLEEQGIGYDTGVALVPLVAQADLFDLSVGDGKVRPDADMGYQAAKLAFEAPNYQDGNYGAGCGASVGKIAGMDYAMKTGIGSYAIQIGDLKIGAVVALNALGDVYDWRTGEQVAGLLTEDKKGLRSTVEYMSGSIESRDNKFTGNTTLAVVVTNGEFNKSQLCKIAGMAHNGYARSINPVHTSADGDSIYAVSVGSINADQDLVGTLAAEVVSEALLRAVYNSEGAYGLPSASDLEGEEAGWFGGGDIAKNSVPHMTAGF